MRILILLATALVIGGLGTIVFLERESSREVTSTPQPIPKVIDPDNLPEQEFSELKKRGEQLFKTRGCISCHIIVTGDMDSIPFGLRPLQSIGSRYTLSSLSELYRSPTPPMPPVRIGNEEDELPLSTYLLSLD